MTPFTKPNTGIGGRHNFDIVFNIVAYMQIVASPFFAGMIIGLLIYTQFPSNTILVIAFLTSLTGLITGICWATKIWTKEGTLRFMSRIIATPVLDENKNIS